jgi:hypothetical protein
MLMSFEARIGQSSPLFSGRKAFFLHRARVTLVSGQPGPDDEEAW